MPWHRRPSRRTISGAKASAILHASSSTGADDSLTAAMPVGAGPATGVDLDGDGERDTGWIADVDGTRTLGVTTTAHGAASSTVSGAAPQSATALTVRLAGGAAVVLLNTGRSVQIYSYVPGAEAGRLVEVPGVNGEQYSPSLGFSEVDTGLACEGEASARVLYGQDTKESAGR